MKRRQRKDAQETRQRLLTAAAEVFAEKGFWEATHAEICAKACANTAAVNYHFNSKENLYVEAWRHAFEESIRAHPIDGGIAPQAPAADRLHGRILAFMQRMVDPNNYETEIMHKEIANPTGLLFDALQEVMELAKKDWRLIVQELLGEEATEQQIVFCEMSLMGQCFGPMLHIRRTRMERDVPHPPAPFAKFSVEDLADHVTQFTLAGIRGIREVNRKRVKVTKKPQRGHTSNRSHS
jgi:TetR/AcrR family transcriptional regulator, regulator of cefoperazone and chloramphenicol sensitivity